MSTTTKRQKVLFLKAVLWMHIRIDLAIFLRIRIRIGNADLDPDPGARKITNNEKIILFQAFQKGFCIYAGVFYDLLPIKVSGIYHVNVQLFVTAKFDQHPDPVPDWFGSLNPDPH
jgi:hypothetical protein